MKEKINNNEFWEAIKNGYVVVDVRSVGEAKMTGKQFNEAINIPYPGVIDRAEKFFPDKDAKIIFVCNYGNRSGIAAQSFRRKGYNNAHVLATGLYNLD